MIDFKSSDWSIKEPVENSMISFGSLILRGHMTCTMNGNEGEVAFSLFNITSKLLVIEIWLPFLLYFPVELFNPSNSSECWNCTINISRELEHLVFSLKS